MHNHSVRVCLSLPHTAERLAAVSNEQKKQRESTTTAANSDASSRDTTSQEGSPSSSVMPKRLFCSQLNENPEPLSNAAKSPIGNLARCDIFGVSLLF